MDIFALVNDLEFHFTSTWEIGLLILVPLGLIYFIWTILRSRSRQR